MRVTEVIAGSDAALRGVRPGDELVSIGGAPIRDGIDIAYALGTSDEEGDCEWGFERGGERVAVALPTDRPEELGLTIAPDTIRTCPNRCVFCFIDQLPRGLRESLYVKDEDYRLSFAFGNYVTLTNLSDDDYDRIAEQRLSPLYVSVHATDDRVRRDMLGNAAAAPIVESLRRLAREGIDVHTQIVICPALNDGSVLEETLSDLAALGGAIRSIAVVPVGLTAHREGLPTVRAVTPDGAALLLDTVDRWQERFRKQRGSGVVYAADELYLLAEREPPPLESYDDLPQIENGVGLLRSFEADFDGRAAELEGRVGRALRVVVVTGRLAARFLDRVITPGLARAGVEARVIAAENTLLGGPVTVAGLLAGADLAAAIADGPAADLYLVPGQALSEDGVALDGMTIDGIERAAGRGPVVATDDLIGAILDAAEEEDRGDPGGAGPSGSGAGERADDPEVRAGPGGSGAGERPDDPQARAGPGGSGSTGPEAQESQP
jgi:putative radical SAM enzyme (TIGR03279 family)